MYSAIWPLAMAPTIAPTFDSDPNSENSERVRPRSEMMASWVGEEKPQVKPNWMGPRATMRVQRTAETEESRRE
ncbi:Os05g0579050 [Oryza sativa Japonica Group]|uniref:Os05g0579050 protein n=1 Tax=Oryza sativa subsp. japonica TaxID=39947 RepID=A0A0P0WRD7_ORYSJ|nr:hypothetical protein EE612_031325 [Oryza sativa]BAS95503.1 Os05g0579050 [Oryza sativa Japonica Group]